MIKNFRCKETERVFSGFLSRRLPQDMQQRAHAKLKKVHAATAIEDLRLPPSNRLEQLQGNRKGQWSIRVNDQWRICFVWQDGHASDVEIVDYH
jgi:proteic killer suppression protein